MKNPEESINKSPENNEIIVDDEHNVSYDKGTNGFTLDVNKTHENILRVLSVIKEESVITVEGSVVQNQVNSAHLSVINKNASSYTTYFTNSGNRGHNITLSVSKLNGTVLMRCGSLW